MENKSRTIDTRARQDSQIYLGTAGFVGLLIGLGTGMACSMAGMPYAETPKEVRMYDVNRDGKEDISIKTRSNRDLIYIQRDGKFVPLGSLENIAK